MSITEKLKAANRSGIWKPTTEGDLVAGTVVSCEKTTDLFGDERLQVEVIDETTGENVIIWCNQWLGADITRRGVKPGDQLGIRYDGKKKSAKSGYTYNLFSVVTEAAK